MSKNSSKAVSNDRPSLFRALGKSDPPSLIEVDQVRYRRLRIIKHDSWAATALYESEASPLPTKIVCKFNRTQPVGPLPMSWLGRRLADREFNMYQLLSDIPGIAKGYRHINSDGELQTNACGHEFIEGHPLRWHDFVKDDFFDNLDNCLKEMHRRNVAYVDMHKSENIIVNEQGDPCLIDFQISMRWDSIFLRLPLRILQRSDLYHSLKLRRRFRPDLLDRTQEANTQIPWWIRAHRAVATPFRLARRRLLVALGIRKGKGMCQTEAFIEEALQSNEDNQKIDKPIVRLYRLLQSPDYRQRCGTNQRFMNQMITDLLDGGKLLRLIDGKIAEKTRNATAHYRVIEILKSKSFVLASSQWDSEWIENKITEIEGRLSAASQDSKSSSQASRAA